MPAFEYIGDELEVFQYAQRWKAYYAACIREYLTGAILEVGGGLGSTARVLCHSSQSRWVSLEPDVRLASEMSRRFSADPLPAPASVIVGSVASLRPERRFDAIVYIDVLEHIQDDRGELAEAARRLRPGGRLVVLSPAHQFLFSEFDSAIGHFRRYSARSLAAVTPTDLTLERIFYLDSVGMLASLANKLLLRSSRPTHGQIRLWDTVMIPLSRLTDRLLCGRLGKTVIAVWRRP